MKSNIQDPELLSVFSLDESDDDSDEEYFPWSLAGRTLQEVENPYDMAVRIQQANRELFSQPLNRKKHPSRVTFDLVPKLVEDLQLEAVNMTQRSPANNHQVTRRKETFRRKMTPVLGPQIPPPPPSDDQPGTSRQNKNSGKDSKKSP